MPEPIKPTELRSQLFEILDEVLETGQPREISRKGEILILSRATPLRRLDRLPTRECLSGISYDDLPDLHWEYEPGTEFLPAVRK